MDRTEWRQLPDTRRRPAAARLNQVREAVGHPPLEVDLLRLMHVRRTGAGIRYRNRDITAAPWPEDREPGKRYDTLG